MSLVYFPVFIFMCVSEYFCFHTLTQGVISFHFICRKVIWFQLNIFTKMIIFCFPRKPCDEIWSEPRYKNMSDWMPAYEPKLNELLDWMTALEPSHNKLHFFRLDFLISDVVGETFISYLISNPKMIFNVLRKI